MSDEVKGIVGVDTSVGHHWIRNRAHRSRVLTTLLAKDPLNPNGSSSPRHCSPLSTESATRKGEGKKGKKAYVGVDSGYRSARWNHHGARSVAWAWRCLTIAPNHLYFAFQMYIMSLSLTLVLARKYSTVSGFLFRNHEPLLKGGTVLF